MANVEWALEDRLGVEDILVFATHVNDLAPKYDDALCCISDLTPFGASVVMNSLRTHSMVIIGGVLQENPIFVPPDGCLREVRERTGQSSTGLG
jgi:hypothetical protein